MELFDERDNFICQPAEGVLPGDIRTWLRDNTDEHSFARALANVHNKTSWMIWDLDEADEVELPKVQAVFDEWNCLLDELYDKALSVLTKENMTGRANHDLENHGQYFKAAPFMYRNGYKSDTNGGWQKLDTDERVGEEEALQHMMDSRVFLMGDVITEEDVITEKKENKEGRCLPSGHPDIQVAIDAARARGKAKRGQAAQMQSESANDKE